MSNIEQTQEGTPGAMKASNTTKTLAPKIVERTSPVDVLTKELFDAEMARLQLEAAQLELSFKKLQYSDLQDQVDDRAAKRTDKTQKARINGATIEALARSRALVQGRCNHRKGGNGAQGVVGGQGDDNTYCVLKHKFQGGEWVIRCLRCGKWWYPVYREDFETEEGYNGALAEYNRALEFPTRNASSTGGILAQWGDGGKWYRKQMKNSFSI